MVETKPNEIIKSVESVVSDFELKKKDKEAYLRLRNTYNTIDRSTLNLFTLQIYAFQNMIRFNNRQKMNTPVGNNEYNELTK